MKTVPTLACVGIALTLAACGVVQTVDVRVTIEPSEPTTVDDLVATITGDAEGLSFRWSVNGGVRADRTTNRVGAAATAKSEKWRVEAMEGDAVRAIDEVTILNSPPTPSVTVPAMPLAGAPIQCSVGSSSTDPDGDALEITVAWTLDSSSFTTTTRTVFENDTVPALTSHAPNVFECTVTASDGEATATGSATATVAQRFAYTLVDGGDALLEKVDLDTLVITPIGRIGAPSAFGDLAWDRVNQKLYLINGRGDGLVTKNQLYTINTTTGAATLVGSHGLVDGFGFGFNAQNNLYIVGSDQNALYRLNPTTAAPTLIGTVAPAPASQIEGMAFDTKRNVLVGLTNGGVFLNVNASNAAVTTLGTSSFVNDFGLTYDPTIDRFWVMNYNGNLFQFDPNAGYGRTTKLTDVSSRTAIALPLPPP